ncbi:MAG: hypothetical protein LBV47_02235 [Bacteroidales bacterium]|nr:hypothetical protein [Bacteroidales bacterium]
MAYWIPASDIKMMEMCSAWASTPRPPKWGTVGRQSTLQVIQGLIVNNC